MKKPAKLAGNSLKEMSFLLSNEEIPTWWTQYPNAFNSTYRLAWADLLLKRKRILANEELFQQALQSLSNIFKLSIDELKRNLVAWNVMKLDSRPVYPWFICFDTVEAPVQGRY